MGYSIHIGEAIVDPPWPEDHEGEERAEAGAWRGFLLALPPDDARTLAGLALHKDSRLADWLEEHGAPAGTMPGYCRLGVRPVALDDAPAFPGDETSARNNGRHPSYGGWHAFCRETSVSALWEELMPGHPGCAPLLRHHAGGHALALHAYRAAHPHAVPRQGKDASERDADLARLEWCVWWMQWALANCSNPAVENG